MSIAEAARRERYFRWFLFFMAIDIIVTPFSLILGHAKVSYLAWHFFKIPFLAMFLVSAAFHVKERIVRSPVTLLFLTFLPFEFLYGWAQNGWSKPFLSHLYSNLMPVFAFSIGWYFCREASTDLYRSIDKWAKRLAVGLFAAMGLYFYLYKRGTIGYFGISTKFALLVAYFLARGNWRYVFLCFVGTVLSGKRSVLIPAALQLMIVLSIAWRGRLPLRRYAMAIAALLVGLSLTAVAAEKGLFKRFGIFFNEDLTTYEGLYHATAGRNLEAGSVVDRLNEDPLMWVMGGGFGATFEEHGIDYVDVKHFSHFSPLAYVLVYGAFFMLMLYGFLFNQALDGLKNPRTPQYLAFASFLLSSFMGAGPISEGILWFFSGMVFADSKRR